MSKTEGLLSMHINKILNTERNVKTNKEVPTGFGCIYAYTVLQKGFSALKF